MIWKFGPTEVWWNAHLNEEDCIIGMSFKLDLERYVNYSYRINVTTSPVLKEEMPKNWIAA